MHKHNFLRIVRFAADAETGGGADAAETSGDNGETANTDQGSATEPAGDGDTGDGAAALGDAGKRALDSMKAERKAARDAATAEKARADALQAQLDGKEAEHAAALESQRVTDEAIQTANRRILRSEIKGAAKGVLNDPADAFEFIDLDQFEVDENGDVDEDAIKAALAALVTKKPYLAVQDGTRFEGAADGGPRKESQKSIDEQIAEATAAGNHRLAISLKRQKAYAGKS